MVVLDRLALLVAAVLRDDAFAAEEGPLEKAVQGLTLIGGPWIVDRSCESEM
jgi:hypothetical protein